MHELVTGLWQKITVDLIKANLPLKYFDWRHQRLKVKKEI